MDNSDQATITVRSAMPSDYEVCAGIDHSVSTEYVWQMSIDSQETSQNVVFRSARLPRSMKVVYPRSDEALWASWREHSAYLVAEYENGIAGYVNIHEQRAQEAAWIADLVVDSAYRMLGVGTTLLRSARQWALEQGLRRIIVETQTKNYPGIMFLQKRGFTFCGYNELYYPNQDIAIFFGQTLK